jgi:glycosyltransferase involved in cell wall biosynthesis
MSKGHFFGGMAARAASVPAIFWQHGIPVASLLERVAGVVPAKAIACPSQVAINAQRALTPGRRICKINPGVPIADIRRSQGKGKAIRHSLGWEHHPIVGTVGRLQAGKGHEVFLQAAARLADTLPELRFVVVGGAILGWEGSYPDDLRRLAGELGLEARLHFAGHQTDVYPWYDALDVVVHPSFGESFGLVPVEAMALGRPLVATAAGGPLEVVEDGVSGLLVPPGDPQRLAEAIDRILGDSSLASDLGWGAVERAKAFSEEGMAERFAELLRSLISDGDRLSRLIPGEGA